MKKIIALLFAVTLISTAPTAFAQDALAQFKQFVAQTQSLSGAFKQTQLTSTGQPRGRAYSGKFAVSRPASFRWEVQSPFSQLLVSNGSTLTLWDADLNQVTQRSAQGLLSNTPAALLLGNAEVFKQFSFTEQGNKDGLQWLVATPTQKDGQFSKIELALRNQQPAKLIVHDAFGGINQIEFSELSNKPNEPASFSFTAPKGADIVKQ